MNSHTIDAKSFQKLFLAGANRINSRKDYINELNVFPVPDGDTGTNMTMTALAAAKEVGNAPEVTVKEVTRAGSAHTAPGRSGRFSGQCSTVYRPSARYRSFPAAAHRKAAAPHLLRSGSCR